MRNWFFTTVLAAFLLCPYWGFTQDLLDSTTHRAVSGRTDTLAYGALIGFQIPASGANQIWNYESLLLADTSRDARLIPWDATSTDSFPNITRRGNRTVAFAPYTQPVYHYEQVSANSRLELGFEIDIRRAFSIDVPTIGSGRDSLVYLPQAYVYRTPRPLLVFPLALNQSWNWAEDRILRRFQLNVPNAGLEYAEGEAISFVNESWQAIGWGTLTLPSSQGQSGQSGGAWLVRHITTSVDSVYLNGNPAPSALVRGFFGRDQGETGITINYLFYSPGFAQAFLELEFEVNAGDTVLREVRYNTEGASPAIYEAPGSRGSIELIQGNVQAFPNPVVSELQLRFTPMISGTWYASIVDFQGRNLWQTPLVQLSSGSEATLRLETESLSPGLYVWQLWQAGRPTASGPFLR